VLPLDYSLSGCRFPIPRVSDRSITKTRFISNRIPDFHEGVGLQVKVIPIATGFVLMKELSKSVSKVGTVKTLRVEDKTGILQNASG
jgi:hypothetical protein